MSTFNALPDQLDISMKGYGALVLAVLVTACQDPIEPAQDVVRSGDGYVHAQEEAERCPARQLGSRVCRIGNTWIYYFDVRPVNGPRISSWSGIQNSRFRMGIALIAPSDAGIASYRMVLDDDVLVHRAYTGGPDSLTIEVDAGALPPGRYKLYSIFSDDAGTPVRCSSWFFDKPDPTGDQERARRSPDPDRCALLIVSGQAARALHDVN